VAQNLPCRLAPVLGVISTSPGDLQPVFKTMLEKAVRICDATFGNIYRWDGDALHLMASHNTPAALVKARRRSPNRPGPETPTGRIIATKKFVHVADMAAHHTYAARDLWSVSGVELAGVRTCCSRSSVTCAVKDVPDVSSNRCR
jgi:hypothetical protein